MESCQEEKQRLKLNQIFVEMLKDLQLLVVCLMKDLPNFENLSYQKLLAQKHNFSKLTVLTKVSGESYSIGIVGNN